MFAVKTQVLLDKPLTIGDKSTLVCAKINIKHINQVHVCYPQDQDNRTKPKQISMGSDQGNYQFHKYGYSLWCQPVHIVYLIGLPGGVLLPCQIST